MLMGKVVSCEECRKAYRNLEALEDLRDNDSICLVCNNPIEVEDWDRVLASYEDDDYDDQGDEEEDEDDFGDDLDGEELGNEAEDDFGELEGEALDTVELEEDNDDLSDDEDDLSDEDDDED